MRESASRWLQLVLFGVGQCFVLAPAAPAPALFSLGPAPGWVRSVNPDRQTRSADSVARGVKHLLREVQVDVSAVTTVYTRVLTRVNEPNDIAGLSSLSIPFDPSFQSVTIHEVTILRDGVKIPQSRQQITVASNETERRWNADGAPARLRVQLEGLRVNDVVEHSYSTLGRNPALGTVYSGWFALGYDYPVGQVLVRVRTPVHRIFKHRAYQSPVKVHERLRGDVREYEWVVDGAQAVRMDDRIPVDFNPYPRVQISEYTDWAQVAAWARPLYANDNGYSARLDQVVEQWRTDKYTQLQWAERALDFVQREIRYAAGDISTHSHRPSSPAEVLTQGFGDCKDKSQLLVALLRKGGIHAYPGLVSQLLHRGIASGLPANEVFDHVVVLAEIEGTSFWLDPTLQHQKGPLTLRSILPYGQALVVGHPEKDLVEIESPSHPAPQLRISERFTLDGAAQSATVSVYSEFRLGAADHMRALILNASASQLRRELSNDFATRYPTAKQVFMAHEDHPETNTVFVTERYELHDFFQPKVGTANFNVTVYGWGPRTYLQVPQVSQRNIPLGTTYPMSIEHTVDIQVIRAVEVCPHNVHEVIQDPSFNFAYDKVVNHNHMVLKFTLENLTDSVPVATLDRYIKKVLSAREAMKQTIELRPVP